MLSTEIEILNQVGARLFPMDPNLEFFTNQRCLIFFLNFLKLHFVFISFRLRTRKNKRALAKKQLFEPCFAIWRDGACFWSDLDTITPEIVFRSGQFGQDFQTLFVHNETNILCRCWAPPRRRHGRESPGRRSWPTTSSLITTRRA
jgi:hypothetical protein